MTFERNRPAPAAKKGALLQTDRLRLPSEIADLSLDAVFADPPFGIGMERHGTSDLRRESDCLGWPPRGIAEAVQAVKPGASILPRLLPRRGCRFAAFREQRGLDFRHLMALAT